MKHISATAIIYRKTETLWNKPLTSREKLLTLAIVYSISLYMGLAISSNDCYQTDHLNLPKTVKTFFAKHASDTAARNRDNIEFKNLELMLVTNYKFDDWWSQALKKTLELFWPAQCWAINSVFKSDPQILIRSDEVFNYFF